MVTLLDGNGVSMAPVIMCYRHQLVASDGNGSSGFMKVHHSWLTMTEVKKGINEQW